MNTFSYNDMRDAYREMYLNEGKDSSYLEKDMKKRQDNNEKARKDMDKVKGQKNPHFESVETEVSDTYSELEVIGDFLIENGFVSDATDVDAFYAHMSDQWKSHIIEKADDNGNTSCWDTHKKVGMKKKGGKMVNNCVPK